MRNTEIIKEKPIANLIKGHKNKWVAFSHDYKVVLDSSKSLPTLMKRVDKLNPKNDVKYMMVGDPNVRYAPTIV